MQKLDYSALRRKRMADLTRSLNDFTLSEDDKTDEYNPEWENAMQTTIEHDHVQEQNYDELPQDVLSIMQATRKEGFYSQHTPVPWDFEFGTSTEATEMDREAANKSIDDIAHATARAKEALIKSRSKAAAENEQRHQHHRCQNDLVLLPFIKLIWTVK
ncbi:hypothetical protein K435DRAFT_878095 [Dendrothele bispora CBS 962.96]|uniref:Uncharacterized protein n=1 Tax=Dendrothele bispora (strain CBS 962.96) TaxID=1314807 RepID=A0A4S8KNR5_DENBC|nr:hypothetical protein K435DRAFT_878095 [Dendrothele bispora CBS 962.96]